MLWLFRAARRLRELGILGMNRRNAACILDSQSALQLSDRRRQAAHGGPLRFHRRADARRSMPRSRRIRCCASCRTCWATAAISSSSRTAAPEAAASWSSWAGMETTLFATTANDCRLDSHEAALLRHSLRHVFARRPSGCRNRAAASPPAPDIRGHQLQGHSRHPRHLYRNEPAMAMLRLPTRQSNGRANLHQGGIGTGVDLESGITDHAVQHNRFVEKHPDTGCRSWACRCRTGRSAGDVAPRGQGGGTGLHRRGHRRGRAAKGRCCWRRTPVRAWRSRSRMAADLLPRLQAIDDLLDRPEALVPHRGIRRPLPTAPARTESVSHAA